MSAHDGNNSAMMGFTSASKRGRIGLLAIPQHALQWGSRR